MLPIGGDPSSGAAAKCTAPFQKHEQLDANRQQKAVNNPTFPIAAAEAHDNTPF
jgi:hypothetical protein